MPKSFLCALVLLSSISSAARAEEGGLTLPLAMEAMNEAFHACSAKGYRVAVTIVDPDGVIKLEARGDGSPIHSQRFSFRKAYTVMSMGPMLGVESSGAVAKFINSANPAGTAIVGAGSTDLLFIPGAVLLRSGDRAVGAIGVSGAPLSADDEVCAEAAAAKIRKP